MKQSYPMEYEPMKQFLKITLPILVLTGSVLVVQGQNRQKQPVGQTQQEPRQRVITGRIVKSGDGKYVLVDTALGAIYQLDDQFSAKNFNGKLVKVSGIVGPNNTIYVTDIKSAS
jgi:hypothetical protein